MLVEKYIPSNMFFDEKFTMKLKMVGKRLWVYHLNHTKRYKNKFFVRQSISNELIYCDDNGQVHGIKFSSESLKKEFLKYVGEGLDIDTSISLVQL